jgi:hypothetical protein
MRRSRLCGQGNYEARTPYGIRVLRRTESQSMAKRPALARES